MLGAALTEVSNFAQSGPVSESTQIILAIIGVLVPIVTAITSTWGLVRTAQIKRETTELKQESKELKSELKSNAEKLETNTAYTRKVGHQVANAAQTAIVVKETLDESHKATEAKLDRIEETGAATKRMVNGERTKELRIIANLARRLAQQTKAPEDEANALEAEKNADEKERQQAELEAGAKKK